jgi:uncharacterized protein (TIGR03435 family)
MTRTARRVAAGLIWLTAAALGAQTPPPAEYDVVSIKRSAAGANTAGMRTLPDGTFMMANQPIRSIIMAAAPVPVRDVTGLPAWAISEPYDIVAKPPTGATVEQRRDMFRRMFEERMQLKAHIEEREQNAFALVLNRADGRLGPQLSVSTLDCGGSSPQSQPQVITDYRNRCGTSTGPGLIVAGGVTMEAFVRSIAGLSGGIVNNRTGLQGAYALTLRFMPRAGPGPGATTDDAPEFATALREQLGLRLQPERTKVPILVVDSISRPTEN